MSLALLEMDLGVVDGLGIDELFEGGGVDGRSGMGAPPLLDLVLMVEMVRLRMCIVL